PGRDLGFLDLPDTWGPRGLAVSLSDGATSLDVDRSFVLWQSAESVPQTRISVIAPLTGNPVDVPMWTVAADHADGAGDDAAQDETDEVTDETAVGGAGAGSVLGTEAIGPLVSAHGRLAAVLTATTAHPHVAFAV